MSALTLTHNPGICGHSSICDMDCCPAPLLTSERGVPQQEILTALRGRFFCHVSLVRDLSRSVTPEEQIKKSKSRPDQAGEETTASPLTVRKKLCLGKTGSEQLRRFERTLVPGPLGQLLPD
jgi:hypothetical protein